MSKFYDFHRYGPKSDIIEILEAERAHFERNLASKRILTLCSEVHLENQTESFRGKRSSLLLYGSLVHVRVHIIQYGFFFYQGTIRPCLLASAFTFSLYTTKTVGSVKTQYGWVHFRMHSTRIFMFSSGSSS